ncbi:MULTISPECIES: hypothetical protein [Novacetimonas]|nr:hypothetical protein [Novacetimonas hansenii]
MGIILPPFFMAGLGMVQSENSATTRVFLKPGEIGKPFLLETV